MNRYTKKLLRAIFHEAHVVDFDFSQWDRRVRLVVIAWLGKTFPRHGPLHNVDFVGVKSLSWESRHLGIVLDAPEQHCQWDIMESKTRGCIGDYSVRLSGFGPTPELTIKCKDVAVSNSRFAVINRVNPGWGDPYKPLARPGLEELCKVLRRKQRRPGTESRRQ